MKRAKPNSVLHLLSARIFYGECGFEDTQFRYDIEKRWIIDPLLQDSQRNGRNLHVYAKMEQYVSMLSERVGDYYDRGIMHTARPILKRPGV